MCSDSTSPRWLFALCSWTLAQGPVGGLGGCVKSQHFPAACALLPWRVAERVQCWSEIQQDSGAG